MDAARTLAASNGRRSPTTTTASRFENVVEITGKEINTPTYDTPPY